ncbi:MAG: rhomboid family intramembrane serine protease [Isosphaeraceae bacterium]|nr:rhomboid family intramembrane serine protease [Isosphaeraceae bacterium]
MREIGILPSAAEAGRLADHLRGLGITSKLLPRGETTSIWVHDENHLARAQEEFRLFLADPDDPRFDEGRRAARALDEAERRAERLYRKQFVDLSARWNGPIWRQAPVTIFLLAVAIGVGIFTGLGKDRGPLFRSLTFSVLAVDPERFEIVDLGLQPIREGQVWRLITPIFLHFGVMHLLFNALWMISLGRMIEPRRGSLAYLAIVLLVGVISNCGQFAEGELRDGFGSTFGGLSGVVYGLFGYAWVRGRTRPEDGIGVDSRNVQLMMFWFVICLTGVVGPVANSAHGVGLVVGMLLALTPL